MGFLKGILLLSCAGLVFGAEPQSKAPATMMKIVVRLTGPGIQPGSFSSLPKTIYSAAPHFARIEDPPDARQKIQKLTIIAEPDAYSVNLIDRKGTHAVDQGRAGDLHLPVILPFDPKHRLGNLDRLEFGSEVEFFEDAGAKKVAGPIINSKPTDAYELKFAGATATLVVKPDTKTPIKLSWQTPEGLYTYEYISYTEVPFDRTKFSKPTGIAFREIPSDTAGERG